MRWKELKELIDARIRKEGLDPDETDIAYLDISYVRGLDDLNITGMVDLSGMTSSAKKSLGVWS